MNRMSFIWILFSSYMLFVSDGEPTHCIKTYPNIWTDVYNGMVNTTVTGKPCRYWNEITDRAFYGKVNYCTTTNKDQDSAKGAWCYTGETWERCYIPICDRDCIITNKDKNYVGILNVTSSGYKCQPWSFVADAAGKLTYHQNETLNYCRTPSGDDTPTPWCYTTNQNNRWEKCDVPLCSAITAALCPDLNGSDFMASPLKLTGYSYGENVTFECKAGYQLVGQKTITCTVDNPQHSIVGQWNYQQPVCLPIQCSSSNLNSPKFHIENSKPQYSYHEVVTVRCNAGYNGTTVRRNCIASDQWSGSDPVCSPIQCSSSNLNSPKFHIENSKPQYSYHEVVTVRCNAGYNGTTVRRNCIASDQWSGSDPVCSPIQCLPPISNSETFHTENPKQQYSYNEVVTVRCNTGYFGLSVNKTCTASDQWTGGYPICNPIHCSASNLNSPKFHIENSKPQYSYHEVVTVRCNAGYNGTTVRRNCIASDQWSGSDPVCSPKICLPLVVKNYTVVNPEKDSHHYKENVVLSCKAGYNGTSVDISCNANGIWPTNRPSCKRILCKFPLELGNMNASVTPKREQYVFGDTVTYFCQKGFTGFNKTSSCISHDKWNDTTIQCQKVACPQFLSADGLKYPYSNETFYYGEQVTFLCEDGYKPTQPSTIECLANDTNNSVGRWNDNQPKCLESLGDSGQSSSLGGAIGGGVSAIVVIIIVVIIIVLMKRRNVKSESGKTVYYKESSAKDGKHIYSEVQKSGIVFVEENKPLSRLKTSNKGPTYSNETDADGGYYDFSEGLQMSKTAVPIKDFYNYVENGRGENGNLETEFQNLKSGLQNPTTAAMKPGNKIKNKYKNLYAYDETRVVLETTPQCTSDYINSSYINGYGCLKQYIASQGPQDNTVNEFWMMVLQVDCGKIVMLTNVFEEAKQKCNHYWPETVGNANNFEDIVVTLTKEDIYSDFTIRHLKLQRKNLKKKVIQFHFTAWPDKDVPKYSSSLVHFRHKVNSTVVPQKGPIIVHCSAGIGRTGTYIALDYVVTEAKETGYVDVFRCVETLRRQRVNMVQTARQYVFLHDTVLEALMCPNSGIPSKDYPDVYKELMKFDSNKKKHKLQVEYDLLNSMSRKHDEEVFEVGKSAENKSKNRYSNIIPVGTEMPRLTSTIDGHNEYINAVFLPGYKMSRAFVITQMPMETTVIDFWRLVNDYRISIIVMMNSEYDQRDVYWPASMDKPLTLGPFKIEQKKLVTEKAYNMLVLSLTSNHEQRRVNLFQQTFWSEDKTIPDKAEDFFSFITEVEDAHGRESREGPLLVHCLNGCDKSGLYCVMATVIERLRIEQDVDIQHIIKQMRNRRPQIIPCYEQFRFLYDAVIEYLKQFETYANFS